MLSNAESTSSSAVHHHHHHRHHHNKRRRFSARLAAADSSGNSTNSNSTSKQARRGESRHRNNNEAARTSTTTREQQQPPPPRRRRSSRGTIGAMSELAHLIAVQEKRVVIITGAGLSVASGVRPFRRSSNHSNGHHHHGGGKKRRSSSKDDNDNSNNNPTPSLAHNGGVLPTAGAIWDDVIWTTATRRAFRKDPLRWYNDFWLQHFSVPRASSLHHDGSGGNYYQPNPGHHALQELLSSFGNVCQITQNVDGLQNPNDGGSIMEDGGDDGRLIEAHGRLGLYKCLGEVRTTQQTRTRRCISSDGEDESSGGSDSSDDDDDSNVDDTTTVEEGNSSSDSSSRNGSGSASGYSSSDDNQYDGIVLSDDSDDSDDDEDRIVHLGHRRKTRKLLAKQQQQLLQQKSSTTLTKKPCPYQFVESLQAHQLEPPEARAVLAAGGSAYNTLDNNNNQNDEAAGNRQSSSSSSSSSSLGEQQQQRLTVVPRCPNCGNHVLPQALLFDEGYHAHSFYQFRKMEDWIMQADVIVFCGTSFSVRLTEAALKCARENRLPVYNFNIRQGESLQATAHLNASNILGPAAETLPQLLATCRSLRQQQAQQPQQQQQQQQQQS